MGEAIDHVATEQINQLKIAITQIVEGAIKWLSMGDEKQNRSPVAFGRRKLGQLLKGSSNGVALKFQFYNCPYWGALAFMSVRRIESIIGHMANLKILTWNESRHYKMPVLGINERRLCGNKNISGR